MIEYFVEKGSNAEQVLQRVNQKYGDKVHIITQKTSHKGRILGFFIPFYKKTIVEISGYRYSQDIQGENKQNFLNQYGQQNIEKMEILLEKMEQVQHNLQLGQQSWQSQESMPLQQIQNWLTALDFSFSYTQKMIQYLKKHSTLDELSDFGFIQKKLTHYIKDHIHLYIPQKDAAKVNVLVGPTGVGKTTTIAKLAGLEYLEKKNQDIMIVSIDNYRIGAAGQMQTYAQIMDIPFYNIQSKEQMEKLLQEYPDTTFFVDTAGRSPQDQLELEKMKDFLDIIPKDKIDIYLTISATTSYKDLVFLLEKFILFNWKAVIITKIDETPTLGSVLSFLAEHKLSLAYYTDGQSVPNHIRALSQTHLIELIYNFLILYKESKNHD